MPSESHAAGPPPQLDAGAIALGLRKLGVVGSVLYVAAHPDDENTALISALANGVLVRTGYLSLTRGDGGQNLIGAEQGPALGLVRTQELLAARRVDGGEQFFTRARDFGYSKSPEETLRIWGKDEVLADMVAVIRRFRPDVIITRFSPEPAETHGHHTASAILAVQAFRAAADPKFHPEQLTAGLTPWQARRLLWNRSSWGVKPGEDLSGFSRVDVGGYSPLLGASFGEIAADSRSMHKSQGFGVARSRGPALEYFKVLADAQTTAKPTATPTARPSAQPAKPAAVTGGAKTPEPAQSADALFAGIELGWKRVPGAARLAGLVTAAVRAFDASAPHRSIPALLAIADTLDAAPDDGAPGWRAQKRREVDALVLACAGVFTDATATDHRAAPGSELELTIAALNRSPAMVTLDELRLPDGKTILVRKALTPATPFESKQTIRLGADVPLSTPYWLQSAPAPGLYHVTDGSLIGAPEGERPLQVRLALTVAGHKLTVERAVAFKWTDQVAGELYRPLEITPAVSVRPAAGVMLFAGASERTLDVDLVAGIDGAQGALRAEAPRGWTVEPSSVPLALGPKGSTTRVTFKVRPAAGAAAGTLKVAAHLGGDSAGLGRGVVHIQHPHIPIQTYLVDADVRLVPLALVTGGRRIGYLPGPGDEVPAALRGVGYDVTLLGDADLGRGSAALAPFDAVVVGVRAFNVNERLRAAHAPLMAYVAGGGTLVVQYNTNNRLSRLSAPIGPWPFEIGQKRVTDEAAAVTFAPATHPLLTAPNRISSADFEGWVQERGLYFAETWDPRYERPLVMNDAGEAPAAGSLLWARHGKGTFVYTGLAFFRQLPAGVPGAFRLFANLLAGGGTHGR